MLTRPPRPPRLSYWHKPAKQKHKPAGSDPFLSFISSWVLWGLAWAPPRPWGASDDTQPHDRTASTRLPGMGGAEEEGRGGGQRRALQRRRLLGRVTWRRRSPGSRPAPRSPGRTRGTWRGVRGHGDVTQQRRATSQLRQSYVTRGHTFGHRWTRACCEALADVGARERAPDGADKVRCSCMQVGMALTPTSPARCCPQRV